VWFLWEKNHASFSCLADTYCENARVAGPAASFYADLIVRRGEYLVCQLFLEKIAFGLWGLEGFGEAWGVDNNRTAFCGPWSLGPRTILGGALPAAGGPCGPWEGKLRVVSSECRWRDRRAELIGGYAWDLKPKPWKFGGVSVREGPKLPKTRAGFTSEGLVPDLVGRHKRVSRD